MALSVAANGGNGVAHSFRQARPLKQAEERTISADPPQVVSLRPRSRSGIDSTGSGIAHVSAALTVYLSKLGGAEEAGQTTGATTVRSPAPTGNSASTGAPARSGAADLLRVLDAYDRSHEQRLTG